MPPRHDAELCGDNGDLTIPAPQAGGEVTGTIPDANLTRYYAQKPQESEHKIGAGWIYEGYEEYIDLATRTRGYITVPIDYSNPNKGDIALEYISYRLKDQSKAKGTLFFHPGCPGSAPQDHADYYGFIAHTSPVHDSYPALAWLQDWNIVAIAQRGAGGSIPTAICDPHAYDNPAVSTPVNVTNVNHDDEVTKVIEHEKTRAEGCFKYTGQPVGWNEAKTANYLKHVSTIDAVRDLDVARSVFQDDKFNMIGISYGTQIAYQYAATFPKNVGKLAIDGVIDPNSWHGPTAADTTSNVTEQQLETYYSSYLRQSASFSRTINKFAEWCKKNHAADCPLLAARFQPQTGDLTDDSAPVNIQILQNILRRLNTHPIKVHDVNDSDNVPATINSDTRGRINPRYLTHERAALAVMGAMYSERYWEDLYTYLKLISTDENYDGEYASDGQKAKELNEFYMLSFIGYAPDYSSTTVINCADWGNPHHYTRENFITVAELANRYSPISDPGKPFFSAPILEINACLFWPFAGSIPVAKKVENLPDVLVVSTRYDAATPYENGAKAAALLNGHPVTVEGNSHGAFDTDKACIDDAYRNYFTTGEIKAPGTVDRECTYEPAPWLTEHHTTPDNPDPTSEITAELSKTQAAHGQSVTAKVTGLSSTSEVTFELHSNTIQLGKVTPTNGEAALTFAVPENVTPGKHTVVILQDGKQLAALPLTVVDEASAPKTGDDNKNAAASSKNLANTGSQPLLLSAVSGATLLLAGLTLLAARRRQQAS